MGSDQGVELLRQLLWNSAWVAAPVLVAALLIGVLVSVLQVATQLQEMTLSYIPKLVVSALVLMALAPWMIHRVTVYAVEMIRLIPSLG